MSERPERAIRILLADASRITTMGIRQVIEKEADMEIVGVASDGEEAVAKTNELEPDVLIIEVDLPRLGGIKATQRVRRELPAVGVVILTAQDQEQILFEAIRAGAAAYLHKDCEPTELIDSLPYGHIDCRTVGHVGRAPMYLLILSGKLAQLATDPLELSRPPRADQDRGPRRYERTGDLPSEPAVSTGNEGDPASERL